MNFSLVARSGMVNLPGNGVWNNRNVAIFDRLFPTGLDRTHFVDPSKFSLHSVEFSERKGELEKFNSQHVSF